MFLYGLIIINPVINWYELHICTDCIFLQLGTLIHLLLEFLQWYLSTKVVPHKITEVSTFPVPSRWSGPVYLPATSMIKEAVIALVYAPFGFELVQVQPVGKKLQQETLARGSCLSWFPLSVELVRGTLLRSCLGQHARTLMGRIYSLISSQFFWCILVFVYGVPSFPPLCFGNQGLWSCSLIALFVLFLCTLATPPWLPAHACLVSCLLLLCMPFAVPRLIGVVLCVAAVPVCAETTTFPAPPPYLLAAQCVNLTLCVCVYVCLFLS